MVYRSFVSIFLVLAISLLSVSCQIKEDRVEFDVKAGKASETLKQFSVQSGINILFSENDLQGIETQKISGKMTPEMALEKMISDSGLIFHHDKDSQAIAVYYPREIN